MINDKDEVEVEKKVKCVQPTNSDACSKDDDGAFLRDELEDGAIYHVELKRIIYNSFLDDCPTEDNSCPHAWETFKVRQIKAGTLQKLVDSLLNEDGTMDSTYVNAFLATYRSFTSCEQVMELIIRRFSSLASAEVKDELNGLRCKSLRSVIHVWLDTYPEDFRVAPDYQCLNRVIDSAENLFRDTELVNRCVHRLQQFRKYEHLKGQVPGVKYQYSLRHISGGNKHSCNRVYDFTEIPSDKFAEQLTNIDADLFRRVVPHHCLGAVWSKRTKKSEAPTITATIDQFNAVLYRVITTILRPPSHKTSHRAKVIMKWIEIAQELRGLKNFSSMKAIISGLQSNPIYRLQKTWSFISKDYSLLFGRLSEIFSEENNQINFRELLMKEGTAKYVEADPKCAFRLRRSSRSTRKKTRLDMGMVSGTVPYLGTFLTDLTMIDAAIPDTTNDGLINFDKKRKEFEVIAQLKLLQSAASTYQILPDPQFSLWFDSVDVIDEKAAYEISCRLEPPTPALSLRTKTRSRMTIRRSSTECLPVPLSPSSFVDRMAPTNDTSHSSKSICTMFNIMQIRHSLSVGSLPSCDDLSPDTLSSEHCIIKASVESLDDLHDSDVYHSVQLRNTDHTQNVIERILKKHGIGDSPECYNILQLLPDGEFHLPEKCNVFYAMNSSPELLFVVRHKTLETSQEDKNVFRSSTFT